jgi:hypothetical protein
VSKDEIKYEINKVLDHLPDRALEELLSYLKKLDRGELPFSFDEVVIKKILTEDKELLQKLAK